MNNAGLLNFLYIETEDGFEGNVGVNYLGHVLLTNLLLDKLEASQPSRIVSVSSSAHRWGPFSWDATKNRSATNEDLKQALEAFPASAYGFSKLAQVLWTQELAKRLADKQIYVNAVNPGSVHTAIVTTGITQLPDSEAALADFIMSLMYNPLLAYDADTASLTQLYLATSPEVETKDIRGKYFEPLAIEVPADSYPEQVQQELWSWTENVLNEWKTNKKLN
jgi:retinol dehydrogenase-14